MQAASSHVQNGEAVDEEAIEDNENSHKQNPRRD